MTVEDWAEIRRLHRAEEMPIKARADRQRAPRPRGAGVLDVERRELTDYDAAFGLLDTGLLDAGRVDTGLLDAGRVA